MSLLNDKEMNVLVGKKIKIIDINLDKIRYRDWMEVRSPQVADVAEVIELYENEALVLKLKCEPKLGYPIWTISISAQDLEYELV